MHRYPYLLSNKDRDHVSFHNPDTIKEIFKKKRERAPPPPFFKAYLFFFFFLRIFLLWVHFYFIFILVLKRAGEEEIKILIPNLTCCID